MPPPPGFYRGPGFGRGGRPRFGMPVPCWSSGAVATTFRGPDRPPGPDLVARSRPAPVALCCSGPKGGVRPAGGAPRRPAAAAPARAPQARWAAFGHFRGVAPPADGRSGPYALTGASGRGSAAATGSGTQAPAFRPRAAGGTAPPSPRFRRFDACRFRSVPLVGSSGGAFRGGGGCAERRGRPVLKPRLRPVPVIQPV